MLHDSGSQTVLPGGVPKSFPEGSFKAVKAVSVIAPKCSACSKDCFDAKAVVDEDADTSCGSRLGLHQTVLAVVLFPETC